MELREALSQISDIRQQMAKSEVFRGYRSLTVGFSGLLGITGALLQPIFVPSPEQHLSDYVGFWMIFAALSMLVAGGEMAWRAYRSGPGMSRDMTRLAVEQFMPSLVVGTLLTLCIVRHAPSVAWMLPGLWAMVFGLGVFASFRLLPREACVVAVYYAVCSCYCIVYGQEENALAPWLMGCTFGGGQLLAASILYITLERGDEH